MTKRQQRTAKKLALPVIAMAMLTTVMAVSSLSRPVKPHGPQAAARPAHVQQRTATR